MKRIIFLITAMIVSLGAHADYRDWERFVGVVNGAAVVVNCAQRPDMCQPRVAPPPAYVTPYPAYTYDNHRHYRHNYLVCRWVPDYDYYGNLRGHVKVCR